VDGEQVIWIALLACKGPETATAELETVTRSLWTDWADPDAMQVHATDLRVHTEGIDYDANWQDRSALVTAFDRSFVDDLVEHDRDPQETVGIGVFYKSPYTIVDHFAHIRIEDRTVMESTAPNLYDRTFIEGDADCMLSGECEFMRSHNRIRRESFIHGEMTYELIKEWRWVETEHGDALCARSYQLEESEEPDNKLLLLQSYSLDVWLPEDNASRRYHLSWQETDSGSVVDADELTTVLGAGIEGVLESQDEWLDENL
jgi:hypothetical protein